MYNFYIYFHFHIVLNDFKLVLRDAFKVGWLELISSYINFSITDFTTNNCGAYWSDGKFQQSVDTFQTDPVSELDNTCQVHDKSYFDAQGDISALNQADKVFYDSNYWKGPRRTAYALLVKYGNALFRSPENNNLRTTALNPGSVSFDIPKFDYNPTLGPDTVSISSRHVPTPPLYYDPSNKKETAEVTYNPQSGLIERHVLFGSRAFLQSSSFRHRRSRKTFRNRKRVYVS